MEVDLEICISHHEDLARPLDVTRDQTQSHPPDGRTGITARAIHMFLTSTAGQVLELGQIAALVTIESTWSAQLTHAAMDQHA